MTQYVISCCSTVDLPEEVLKEKEINYVPFHFSINDKEYMDDLGKSLKYEDFYNILKDDVETKTSQVNFLEFIDYFTPFLKEGKDILHITLSSGISGVYNSACLAMEELKSKFPERKIYIVDSLAASSGYGLLVELLAKKRDEGASIEEVRDYAEEIKLNINHWFFSTDLKYYVKGGRISKTSAFFGSMLKICPLLNVNNYGKLIPREKVQGKKNVIRKIVEMMESHAENGLDYDGPCIIGHSDLEEDAREVKKLIEERFPHLRDKVRIYWVGTTIGSHTGPGTISLFFYGKKREE